MNTTQVLFAFLVCLVICCLTLSQPLQQTSAQEWYQQIKESHPFIYLGYMYLSLAAASAGMNVFEHPDTLSSDCVRTARVIMNSILKPSINKPTIEIMKSAIKNTVDEKARNRNPAELFCEKLNEAVKLSKDTLSDFEEQKNKVELPKPEKSYILEVPQGINFTQYSKDWSKIKLEIKDVELIKFVLTINAKSGPELTAVAKLAQYDGLGPIVDAVFTQALEDHIKEISKKPIYLTSNNTDVRFDDFIKLFDEYFMKNAQLNEQYKKLVDEEKRRRSSHSQPTSEKPSDLKPKPSMKLGIIFKNSEDKKINSTEFMFRPI